MSTAAEFTLYATSPKGLEYLLVDELRALGAVTANEKLAGVEFSGDLALIYKACLWSRLANRILLKLTAVPAHTPEALYRGVQTIAWEKHLHPDGTLAVTVNSSNSEISHTMFAAQKVKDAIVDQFRAKFNRRPDVAREKPDLHINVYINRNEATISLDLSGESLHRRGYRLNTGAAPLKENLAAAILLRAQWPAIAKTGGALFDPMCGSGTLLIEAAMLAADIAPGLNRKHFGFIGWENHKPATWEKYLNAAKSRAEKGLTMLPEITGYDADASAVAIAFENIERAGLRGKIHVEKRELAVFAPNSQSKRGLVVTNPPYGERLGEMDELQPLYTCLGDRLKSAFPGWHAAVFTGNPDLGKVMGIRAKKFYTLFNGTIPCKLLLFDINPEKFIDRSYHR